MINISRAHCNTGSRFSLPTENNCVSKPEQLFFVSHSLHASLSVPGIKIFIAFTVFTFKKLLYITIHHKLFIYLGRHFRLFMLPRMLLLNYCRKFPKLTVIKLFGGPD